jgi:hypothetical protein
MSLESNEKGCRCGALFFISAALKAVLFKEF